jgi:hypothetical protein
MALDVLPVGTIIAWENETIPDGWQICDGSNGTPDLKDKFIRGASIDGDVRGTGGASTHYHSTPNTGSHSSHNHGGSKTLNVGSASGSVEVTSGSGDDSASTNHSHSSGTVGVNINYADAHSHTTPNTNNKSHLPIYVTRVFIRRI